MGHLDLHPGVRVHAGLSVGCWLLALGSWQLAVGAAVPQRVVRAEGSARVVVYLSACVGVVASAAAA